MAHAGMDLRAYPEDAVDVTGETVEILVGEREHRFFLRENILRTRSAFFEAALNKRWREGQGRAVKLPEDEPQVFKLYLQWLYAGKLFVKKKVQKNDCYTFLAKLYVLGEKLIDPLFQDSVINTMVACGRDRDENGIAYYPGNKIADIIYRNTPAGSPARRLIIDSWVVHGGSSWVEAGLGDLSEPNHEFMRDVARASLGNRPTPGKDWYKALKSGTPCAYHKHDKDQPCDGKTT